MASEFHKGKDVCVLFARELSTSNTVLGTEGRLNPYLLSGPVLGLPVCFVPSCFPGLMSSAFLVYSVVWWSTCISNFLRKVVPVVYLCTFKALKLCIYL